MDFWEWIEKEKENYEFLKKKKDSNPDRKKLIKKYFNRRIAAILGVYFNESGLYEEQFYENNFGENITREYVFFDRDKFNKLVKKIEVQEKGIEKNIKELQLLCEKNLSNLYNQDQVNKSEVRLRQKLIDHYNTGKKIEDECFFSDVPEGKVSMTEEDKKFFKMLLDLYGRQKIEWMNRNKWENFPTEQRKEMFEVTEKILNEDNRWVYRTLGSWGGYDEEDKISILEEKLKFPEFYRIRQKLFILIEKIENFMEKYRKNEFSMVEEKLKAYSDINKKLEKSLDNYIKQWRKIEESQETDKFSIENIKDLSEPEFINALICGDISGLDAKEFEKFDVDDIYDKDWNPKNDEKIDYKKYEKYKKRIKNKIEEINFIVNHK